MQKILHRLLKSSTSINTILSLGGNGVTVILGIVFTIVSARTLSPEGFGLFTVLTTTAVIIASVADFGTATTLNNFLPRAKNRQEELISLLFWFQLLVCLGILFFVTSLIPYWKKLDPEIGLGGIFLIFLLASVFVINGFGQKVLRAQSRFTLVSGLQIFDGLTKLSLIFLLVLPFKQRYIFLSATFLSALISGILGLKFSIKRLIFKFNLKLAKKIFSFAKWGASMEIFTIFYSKIDILFLSAFSTSYQTGIYSAATRITLVFRLLYYSLSGVFAPRLASINTVKQLGQYSAKLFLLISGVSLTLIPIYLFSGQIVNIIYGNDYLETVNVFKICILAAVPLLLSIVPANAIIYTLGDPGFVARTNLIQLLIIIYYSLRYMPSLGASAPALALLVANIFFLTTTGTRFAFALLNQKKLNNIHSFGRTDKFSTPDL